MQKFEQIIRQALSKIDASNPQMRQKIYENIWLIQEKALAASHLNKEQKQERRNYLTVLLKTTEKDYRKQYNAAPKSAEKQMTAPSAKDIPSHKKVEKNTDSADKFSATKADFPYIEPRMQEQKHPSKQEKTAHFAPSPSEEETDFMPRIDPIGDAAGRQTPYRANKKPTNIKDDSPVLTAKRDHHYEDADSDSLEKEVRRKTKKVEKAAPAYRRKLRFRTCVISTASILVAAFVGWSFYNSFGNIMSQEQHKFSGLMQLNNDKNGWVEIFNPVNATGLSRKGAATANLHNEPDANFIRITTEKPGDEIVLDVGQGALIPLRGKTAVFNLLARSAGNIMGHLKITADFGSGAPENYNFELSPTTAIQTFRLFVPKELNGGVKFYLSSDMSQGKPQQIDIFSLFVRPVDAQGH